MTFEARTPAEWDVHRVRVAEAHDQSEPQVRRGPPRRRLRVVAVLASLMGGGAERQMLHLLRHLDRTQFDMTLCLVIKGGELLGEVPPDVPLIGLGFRSRRDAPVAAFRLARTLRKLRPDVILSKVDYASEVAALAVTLAGTGTPLVCGEESVQSGMLRALDHPRLRRALLRCAYQRAACVVAPSPGVAEDLQRNVGVRRTRFAVIPNMIDLSEIRAHRNAPTEHRFAGSALPLIVTAGRLYPGKGQDDLIRALQVLNGTRPCNLLVLGDGMERDRLQTLTRQLAVADRVSFMGFVANPFALMAQADVFVSPSHLESFGNVIVEAMAVGIPVVSTRVPCGPEWLVDDRRTGVFAEPRDPRDLADKIALVLDDASLRRAIVTEASQVASRYDAPIIVGQYEALLASAASKKSAR